MGALRRLAIALLLIGCHRASEGASAVVSDTDAGAPRSAWSIPHRVAGSWVGEGGIGWEAIVVHSGMSHADLMRLARILRAEKPHTFFDLYDDDAELDALVAAQGNDDALPKKWREAHAVGTIAGVVSSTDGGLELRDMQLFEWRSFRSSKL